MVEIFLILKKNLSDVLIEIVCPMGKKINNLMQDKTYLEKVLQKAQKKPK